MVSDCMFWNSNVRFRFQNSVPCFHFLDFRFQNWNWAEIRELVKLNWWLGAGSWELSWRTTARSPGRTELGPEWPELCIKSSKKNPLGERSWGKKPAWESNNNHYRLAYVVCILNHASNARPSDFVALELCFYWGLRFQWWLINYLR